MIGGFVIPRAAPSDVILRNVPLDSRDAQELLSDLQSCKGSADFDFRTSEIIGIESISNSKFLRRFSERRNQLRSDGSTVRECHAFVVATSHEALENAAREKSVTPSLVDTSSLSFLLGNPSMGVHLFKTAESALLHYGETRHWQSFFLLSVKVLLAKGNVVKAQASKRDCLLEPQPPYDHHLTRDTAGRSNELLYIFEYDEEAEVVISPRAILPLAIYHYKLNGEAFKRIVPLTPVANTQKKTKADTRRVAAIIKMKREQAAAEEARRLEALKLAQMSSCEKTSSTRSSFETELGSSSPPLQGDGDVEMVDEYEYTQEDVVEEDTYMPFTGPKLVPLCADIVKDCGYDLKKPLWANRQALALSNSSGVASNTRAIASLRRLGRAYCKEGNVAEKNSLVQICRQLPAESPISAAFHLVIGFLRYQLGDVCSQVELPEVEEAEVRKKLLNTADMAVICKDAEVQCDFAPEVTLEQGPEPSETERRAIITSSVAIQCNRMQQAGRQRQGTNCRSSAGARAYNSLQARLQNSSFDPTRPCWQGQNRAVASPAMNRGAKPQPIVLDEDPCRRNSSDDNENDEHFVLRLIVEAMTESTNRRPSNTALDRLEQAFFRSLDRTQCAAERDRILLDLASYSQQGRWQLCLEKLGVAYNSLLCNDMTESATRSRAAGQMWAQSLIAARQQGSSLDDLSRRKISRYADNIFDDGLREVARDHFSAAPDRRRSYGESQFAKLSQSAQQARTLSRASLLQLQQMLLQKKTDDIATVLRAMNSSRERNRFDELSLYSQLLNFRRNI